VNAGSPFRDCNTALSNDQAYKLLISGTNMSQAPPPPPPSLPLTLEISSDIPSKFSAPLTAPPNNTVHLASGFVFSRAVDLDLSSNSILSTPSVSPLRILLLKRAPSVRFPLDDKWDFPGGGIEYGPGNYFDSTSDVPADSSVIHAAVREVWEETGLTVRKIAAYVGQDSWFHGEKKVVKFCFLVEVKELPTRLRQTEQEKEAASEPWRDVCVKLMDEEHTEYAWATEEEVTAYEFISMEQMGMVLKAFETWRQLRDSREAGT
jgi:8-oxo-dGTP pyrophosphatase MutT (NUDIX family)